MALFLRDELKGTVNECLAMVVDHFSLVEDGSPCMKLHAFSSPGAGSKGIAAGPQLGEVRSWKPKEGVVSPIEKVIHLRFSVKKLTSQWLFAFSSSSSLVPHFSLGLSTSGSSDTCGVHVDLISKARAPRPALAPHRRCEVSKDAPRDSASNGTKRIL